MDRAARNSARSYNEFVPETLFEIASELPGAKQPRIRIETAHNGVLHLSVDDGHGLRSCICITRNEFTEAAYAVNDELKKLKDQRDQARDLFNKLHADYHQKTRSNPWQTL